MHASMSNAKRTERFFGRTCVAESRISAVSAIMRTETVAVIRPGSALIKGVAWQARSQVFGDAQSLCKIIHTFGSCTKLIVPVRSRRPCCSATARRQLNDWNQRPIGQDRSSERLLNNHLLYARRDRILVASNQTRH
jgi:hypothetical protein